MRCVSSGFLHITANQTCSSETSNRALNHPPEKADREARPHAALAVDGGQCLVHSRPAAASRLYHKPSLYKRSNAQVKNFLPPSGTIL